MPEGGIAAVFPRKQRIRQDRIAARQGGDRAGNGEIEYCLSVFLTDWAWNARAFEQNGYLCIADRREAFVYLPDTLESAASFLF